MRVLRTFFLILSVSTAARCDAAPLKNDAVPFKVEISIDGDSLNTDFYKVHSTFYVNTKIKNTTDRNQEFFAWTQYGWSWISSTPEVSPGKEALKNQSTRITLHPNEEYASRMEMFSNAHNKKPVTFRLGFCPKAQLPISGQRDCEESGGVFWSNQVTLTR